MPRERASRGEGSVPQRRFINPPWPREMFATSGAARRRAEPARAPERRRRRQRGEPSRERADVTTPTRRTFRPSTARRRMQPGQRLAQGSEQRAPAAPPAAAPPTPGRRRPQSKADEKESAGDHRGAKRPSANSRGRGRLAITSSPIRAEATAAAVRGCSAQHMGLRTSGHPGRAASSSRLRRPGRRLGELLRGGRITLYQ